MRLTEGEPACAANAPGSGPSREQEEERVMDRDSVQNLERNAVTYLTKDATLPQLIGLTRALAFALVIRRLPGASDVFTVAAKLGAARDVTAGSLS